MRRSRQHPNRATRSTRSVVHLAVVLLVVPVVAGCEGDDLTDAPIDGVGATTTSEVSMIEPTSEPTDEGSAAEPTTGSSAASDQPDEPPTTADTTQLSLPDDVVDTTPDRTPVTPPAGATETVYDVGTIDAGLTPYITMAVDDLATRLGVATDAVEILTAVIVVWPNSALGCPEPDRSYLQVITDGAVIELGVDGVVYRYHSGGSQTPFLCDRPLDPVPQPA